MHEPVWASCRCYYQKCIYSKSLERTINFTDKETFLREYGEVLEKDEMNAEEVFKEIFEEVDRRKKRSQDRKKNRDTIKEQYKPLHRVLFDEDSGQVDVVKRKAIKIKDDVFTLPIFDTSTCTMILEELDRYKHETDFFTNVYQVWEIQIFNFFATYHLQSEGLSLEYLKLNLDVGSTLYACLFHG